MFPTSEVNGIFTTDSSGNWIWPPENLPAHLLEEWQDRLK